MPGVLCAGTKNVASNKASPQWVPATASSSSARSLPLWRRRGNDRSSSGLSRNDDGRHIAGRHVTAIPDGLRESNRWSVSQSPLFGLLACSATREMTGMPDRRGLRRKKHNQVRHPLFAQAQTADSQRAQSSLLSASACNLGRSRTRSFWRPPSTRPLASWTNGCSG